MNLNTIKVKSYLKNLFNSDHGPVKINNYLNIIDELKNSNYEIFSNFVNINNFEKYITEILNKKIINPYTSESSDKDFNIDKKYFTTKKIKFVYEYLLEKNFDQKLNKLDKINSCRLYPKYKKDDESKPENYRFLTDHTNEFKLIDRIYLDILTNIMPNNLINSNYFKASLNRNVKMDSCCTVASNNTESLDNVVLLDVSKAFDSVEWSILYNNMIEILTEYISPNFAKSITDEYFILLQNRKISYTKTKNRKNIINIGKSISQGLPSSNTIFSILFSSIINKWKSKLCSKIDDYLLLNIYIDDIYIKFHKKQDVNEYFLFTLINELEENKLYVNKKKSFVDPNLGLGLEYNKLIETNFYLGIPFTRNIELYKSLILDNYKEKHSKKIKKNNLECNWTNFYNIIIDKNHNLNKHLIGFLRYKLKPIISYYKFIPSIDSILTDDVLITFIKSKFLIEKKSNNLKYLLIIIFIFYSLYKFIY